MDSEPEQNPTSQSTTTEMKGPSREAVHHAISGLLQSLNANNELDFKTDFPLPVDAFTERTWGYIKAIDLIRHAFLRELDDRTIHRSRNNQLPIYRLPVELLVEIFRLSTISGLASGASRMDRIQKLSCVCVRWQSIIVATPQFWTEIDARDGPNVKHQLERSGSLPLSIKLQSSRDHLLPLPVLSNFMTMIGNEANRICVLTMDATEEDWNVIAPYMAQPMPLLETAELRVDETEEHDLPPLKFGGGSKLSYLRLSNVTLWIPQADDVQWSLARLHMEWMWPTSSSSLLRLLRRCPALTELVIRNTFLAEDANNEPEYPILLSFPHLAVVELLDCPGTISGPLIRQVYAQNIQRLHILEDGDVPEPTLTLLAQPPLSPSRPTLLQSALLNVNFESIEINLGEGYVTLAGTAKSDGSLTVPPGKERGLDIWVADSDPSSAVDLIRNIQFPEVPIRFGIVGPDHDPSVLRSFPSTASIILYGDMDFMEECVVLLRDPENDRIVCPLLSELHLHVYTAFGQSPRDVLEGNDSLMAKIWQLVRARQTVVEGVDISSGGHLRVTCPLERWSKERRVLSGSEAAGRFIDEKSS